MSSLIEGKTNKANISVKRFGYLLSAVFLVGANISLINEWPVTPWLFLILLYLLTGSLWIPSLIKPFYMLFGKYIIKPEKEIDEKLDTSFNKN